MNPRLLFLSFLFITLCLSDCQNSEVNTKDIQAEVTSLNTTSKQKAFLENIYTLDQQVRNDERNALQKHGYDSPEHKKAKDIWMITDKENLTKVDAFLSQYGHPTIAKHGPKAAGAPWRVIHHVPDGVASRQRNFKHVYGAFENGDIEGGALSLYLNQMYEDQFGERMQWDGPFREEQEIDSLIKAMNLLEL